MNSSYINVNKIKPFLNPRSSGSSSQVVFNNACLNLLEIARKKILPHF